MTLTGRMSSAPRLVMVCLSVLMIIAIMPGFDLHLNLTIAGARAGSLPSLPPRGCPHALQWHLPGFHHHRHIFQCEHDY